MNKVSVEIEAESAAKAKEIVEVNGCKVSKAVLVSK